MQHHQLQNTSRLQTDLEVYYEAVKSFDAIKDQLSSDQRKRNIDQLEQKRQLLFSSFFFEKPCMDPEKPTPKPKQHHQAKKGSRRSIASTTKTSIAPLFTSEATPKPALKGTLHDYNFSSVDQLKKIDD